MRLNSMLATVLIFLCSLVISSCSNDELAPISLKNRETANIKLNYPNNQTYSFPLQGGDGNYEISCDKPEIIETKIQKIYVSNNCVTYAFMVDCTKGYAFSVVNYSRECDFMSNAFGASKKLKLGKTAYITLTKDNKILSISNELGETIITTLTYDYAYGTVDTKNRDYIINELGTTIEEYTLDVAKAIKGKSLTKTM